MPVIGRLDKQVEDVLITPVGKDSRREGAGARTSADSKGARGGSRNPGRDERGWVERAREDEPLPVWLL